MRTPSAGLSTSLEAAYTYIPFNRTWIPGLFSPGSAGYPQTPVYDPENGNVYVGDSGGNFLAVLNASTGIGVQLIPFGPLADGTYGDPIPLVLDPVTNGLVVWHSSVSSDFLRVVDLNNSTVSALPSSNEPFPWSGAFDPADSRIYLAWSDGSGIHSNVTVLDAQTYRVVGAVSVPNPCANLSCLNSLPGMAYDPVDRLVWVSSTACDCVYRINVTSDQVVTPSVSTGPVLGGMAVDNRTGTVYVENQSGFVIAINGSTGRISASVYVGGFPDELTYDWRDRVVWVDQTSAGVSAISTANQTVVRQLGDPDPSGVAYDPRDGLLYLPHSIDTNISAIDAASGATRYPTIPFDFGFWFSTYDSARERLYAATVSNTAGPGYQGYVLVLNASSKLPSFQALAPVGDGPTQVAVDSQTGDLYVSNLGSNSVSVLNGTSYAPYSPIPIPSGPIALAYDESTGDLYVAQGLGNSVAVIDGATRSLALPYLAAGLAPSAVAIDSQNGFVYVTNFHSNNVTVINGSARQVIGAGITVGTGPEDIAYDPVNGDLYVANAGSNNVSVIDGTTRQIIATVSLGSPGTPSALAVDPTRNYIYVAEGSTSYTVKVIDGMTNQLIGGAIAVGANPQGLTYDSATDEVFVSTFWDGTIQLLPSPLSARVTPSPTEVGVSTEWIASNGTAKPPITYAYTGLPTGCASRNTSLLVCTPSQSGTFHGEVNLTDANGNVTPESWDAQVTPALNVTEFTSSSPSVPLGGNFQLNVSVTGGVPPLRYSYLDLPAGCTSTNSPTLRCQPTATGTYSLAVSVSDSLGALASASLAISVTLPVGPPVILGFVASPSRTYLDGTVDFELLVANGTLPLSITYGGLPTGCQSESVLNLTCQPRVIGNFTVGATVQDAAGRTAVAHTELAVSAPPLPEPKAPTSPNHPQVATALALMVALAGAVILVTVWHVWRRRGKRL